VVLGNRQGTETEIVQSCIQPFYRKYMLVGL
jgi:hypothetical protein